MPKRKARVKRRYGESGNLDKRKIASLMGGGDWVFYNLSQDPFVTPEERKAAWFENRENLMVQYAAPKGGGFISGEGPGTRPDAWWDFEAPEPLREGWAKRIGRFGDAVDFREIILIKPGQDRYKDRPKGYTWVREHTTEYLRRLELLMPQENRYFNKHGWPRPWVELGQRACDLKDNLWPDMQPTEKEY